MCAFSSRSLSVPFVLITLLLLFTETAVTAEKTSETNAQLKKWLMKFPKADANNDGILTASEAEAFRKQVLSKKNRKNGGNLQRTPLPKPTHADVKYGEYERNVFDIWLAESETPTPLIVYIHGGGFVGGDKRTINARLIQMSLEAGISVAAIHYRFATRYPFPASQKDGARAIQFMRSKSKEWNLDKKRVAAYGGSAGAGISMWLGFHEEMADEKSDDPVERESTRLSAIGSFGGQSSYDPHVIEAWIGGRANEHPSIFKVYNVKTMEQLNDEKLQPIFDEVSAITHLTKDDPPIIMFYSEANKPLPEDARPGQGIHHPIFGLKLKATMGELGIESIYYHRNSLKESVNLLMLNFFKKHFGMSEAEENARSRRYFLLSMPTEIGRGDMAETGRKGFPVFFQHPLRKIE